MFLRSCDYVLVSTLLAGLHRHVQEERKRRHHTQPEDGMKQEAQNLQASSTKNTSQ